MYNNCVQLEFYRNQPELESDRIKMRLLMQMPKTEPVWVGAALLRLGDLLISTGTRIKLSARPSARLSQETI
jgi:hypothetical protein